MKSIMNRLTQDHKDWSIKLVRWLLPNPGTLIILMMFFFAQSAGAISLGTRLPETTTIPDTLHFQGRLTDSSGMPVDVGLYTMRFSLYDTPVGGEPIWTELHDETHAAPVLDGGFFSVLLGELEPLPNPFPASSLYLGITIGNDDEMVPRERLTPSPWAMDVPRGSITDDKLARRFELGRVTTDETWVDVTFSEPFSSIPLVLGTIVTKNGSDPAFLNVRNVTETGFQVRVEESQGDDGDHTNETIAWVAIDLLQP